jgi:hypothetical protein
MSLFDFNKLSRPSGGARPIDPIEIFRAVPALRTGAGKSLVGLLIAQSLVHEGIPRVLYVCATNDLVQQTLREIEGKLGFAHSTRIGGKFSNDLYSTGRAFCLTNYRRCSTDAASLPKTIDLTQFCSTTHKSPKKSFATATR